MDNFSKENLLRQDVQETITDFYRIHYRINQIQAQTSKGIWTRSSKKDLISNPNLLTRIAINNTRFKNAFIVDCDHEDFFEWLSVPNLPPPSYTVKNKNNGRHHHIWWLNEPVPLTAQNDRQIAGEHLKNYIKNIQDGLTEALQGDIDYRGIISKNPLNNKEFEVVLWDGQIQLYRLEDLKAVAQKGIHIRSIDLAKRSTSHRVIEGRNSRIFEFTRLSSYKIAHRFQNDPDGLLHIVEEIALAYNEQETEPLPSKEIRYIARSITKYISNQRFQAKYIKKKKSSEEKTKNRIAGQQRRRCREDAELEKICRKEYDQWRFLMILSSLRRYRENKNLRFLRTIGKSTVIYKYKLSQSSICVGISLRRPPKAERAVALRSLSPP